jgi:dolichol-phosphate mannosyltransferase
MEKLSVVVPVYREAASLRANVMEVRSVLEQHSAEFSYEIILVNDGSPDDSLAIIESLHHEFPHEIGVVNFARTFGQVAAIFAGLRASTGDCAAVISADLQDPPELIPEMFRRWKSGASTVLAVRQSREDSAANSVPSRIFYGLMKAYALPTLPAKGFDFFLAGRTVIDRMLARPEPNGFLQGQVLYASGRIEQIRYTRRRRMAGQSGWGFYKKVKYFLDGFIAYSFSPIRLISVMGIVLFVLGVFASIAFVIQRVFFGTGSPGWTSVMVAIVLLQGLQMLMLGVLGEYLWRTLDQARNRPIYFVDYEKPPAEKLRLT